MGLLSTKKPTGGLLGSGLPPELGIADYALALLAGGVGGAAGLALDNRIQKRRYSQSAPMLDELNAAFAPQSTGGGPMGPGLDGSPVGSRSKAQPPSYSTLAPLLLRARQAGVDTSPYEGVLKGMTEEADRQQPTLYNTRRGIVALDRGGANPRTVYDIPEDPRDPPSGWEVVNGHLQPIKGGPADPDYIAKISGVRRDAVVSRPTPSRARAGGGSGGSTGLPPGYVPK